ncbi:TPA: hypothetical protein N0J00_003495 [Salmonella enterica subsp. enterica serovar Manhattan]|nr:hypothetical protein [Salmonella enterica subsp. enterica serovar Manhattan]
MSLPVPFGAIVTVVKKCWSTLTQIMLIKTYQLSHERWAARHRLGARWQYLGKYLEYSLRLAQLTDKEPRCSRIAFRSKEERLQKVELVFEALGSGLRYQETLCIHDVNNSPIILTLPNIPTLDVFILEDGFAFKVEQYQLKYCKIKLANGESMSIDNSPKYSLIQNWCFNDTWKRRWGTTWNCNAIESARRRIAEYWIWGFSLPLVGRHPLYSPSRKGIHLFEAKSLRWFMTRPWCLNAQFWMAIWSGLFILNDENVLQWRWKDSPQQD